MYLTIVTSFKTASESAQNFFSVPAGFYTGNFREVFSRNNFHNYFFNSLFISLAATTMIMVYIPALSFVVARNMKRSRYYRFVFLLITVGIFVPFQILMLPVVRTMSTISLMNQYGLSLLYLSYAQIQGVFICASYMMTIPTDLDDSGYMDGCNVFTIIYAIIYPISTPIVATLGIINGLWIWNDFLLPLLILNRSRTMWTLPLFQYNFKTTYTFNYNLAFAAFMLSIIPILLVYLVAQKQIVSGLAGGAVKQ